MKSIQGCRATHGNPAEVLDDCQESNNCCYKTNNGSSQFHSFNGDGQCICFSYHPENSGTAMALNALDHTRTVVI